VVRIDLTLEIERPAEDVFELLIDLERLPDWQSTAIEARADGPLAEGTRISERRVVMGRELENELEVTEFDRPRRLTLKALKGPVRFTVDHRLSENGGSTRLDVLAEGKAGVAMKLAEPVIARKAEEELRKDFGRLKEILES
jgi:uncharacterized protein YndB with AHSA1/START domain